MAETVNCLKVCKRDFSPANRDEAQQPRDFCRNFLLYVDMRLSAEKQSKRNRAANSCAHLGYPVRNPNCNHTKRNDKQKSKDLQAASHHSMHWDCVLSSGEAHWKTRSGFVITTSPN